MNKIASSRLNPERILIALIPITLLVYSFATGDKELNSGYIFWVVCFLMMLLAGYYIYLTKNFYSLFLIGFIMLVAGSLLLTTYHANLAVFMIIAGKVSYAAFALFLGYKTVVESRRNKDLELFGTLLTLSLLFPLIHHFYLSANVDYLMIYYFALAFLLSTIMYNENLWDKYNFSEKKILTYILISCIVEVLFISVKLL